MSKKIKNILLIDISTYKVQLDPKFRKIIETRLKASNILRDQRIGMKLYRPHLAYSRGLLTVASWLEQENFIVKYLVYADLNDRRKLSKFIKEVDAVGIYVITPCVPIVNDILKTAKTINPELITFAGGPHINCRGINALSEIQYLDFAVLGEADSRISSLLSKPQNAGEISGIAYRDINGNPNYSGPPHNIYLDPQPWPAYHLLNRKLEKYAHNIQTMRGCSYKCNFCLEQLYWNNNGRIRSIDKVIEELTFLSGVLPKGTLIHFSDPIFNLDSSRTFELCQRLKLIDLGLYFSLDTRTDLVDIDIVKAMTSAGCVYFGFGFESMHSNILNTIHKKSNPENAYRASEILRTHSPKAVIYAHLITGLPGSTYESIQEDIDIIRRLVLDDVVDIIGNKILVPYPGTIYFQRPSELGIVILSQNWARYDRMSLPVYRLDSLSDAEIYFGFIAQESALTEAYTQKVGGRLVVLGSLRRDLGYLYSSYVQS